VTAVTILRRGLDLALAALVAAVVVVGLTAYLTPAVHGLALAIRSGSMEPAIGVGSLVVVLPQDPATLAVGDVVTIKLDAGTVLTHRIAEVVQQDDRRMFRLRGDANPAPDPVLATQDQLMGRVVVALPVLGFLLALMSMPSGVIALLSVGGLLLSAAWFVDDVAAEQADRRARWRRTTLIDVGYDVAPEPR
jgi:signal peptidase I